MRGQDGGDAFYLSLNRVRSRLRWRYLMGLIFEGVLVGLTAALIAGVLLLSGWLDTGDYLAFIIAFTAGAGAGSMRYLWRAYPDIYAAAEYAEVALELKGRAFAYLDNSPSNFHAQFMREVQGYAGGVGAMKLAVLPKSCRYLPLLLIALVGQIFLLEFSAQQRAESLGRYEKVVALEKTLIGNAESKKKGALAKSKIQKSMPDSTAPRRGDKQDGGVKNTNPSRAGKAESVLATKSQAHDAAASVEYSAKPAGYDHSLYHEFEMVEQVPPKYQQVVAEFMRLRSLSHEQNAKQEVGK